MSEDSKHAMRPGSMNEPVLWIGDHPLLHISDDRTRWPRETGRFVLPIQTDPALLPQHIEDWDASPRRSSAHS